LGINGAKQWFRVLVKIGEAKKISFGFLEVHFYLGSDGSTLIFVFHLLGV
jgi:hypothetical protein